MPRTVIQVMGNMLGGAYIVLARPPSYQTEGDPSQIQLAAITNIPPFDTLGETLLTSLMGNGEIRSAIEQAMRVGASEINPIYLYFSSEDASAEAPAWEAFFRKPESFLALDPRWPIGRIVGTPGEAGGEIRRTFAPPVKLFAVLSAKDYPARGEWAALLESLADARWPTQIRVLVREDALLDEIRAAKLPAGATVEADLVPDIIDMKSQIGRFRPNFLHFFCHGTSGETPSLQILTRGNTQSGLGPKEGVVEPTDLTSIPGVTDELWLVTLNCCEGAGAPGGGAVAIGIHSFARKLVDLGPFPAAIGMREKVDYNDANAFCRALYRAIFQELARTVQPDAPSTLEWPRVLLWPRTSLCQGKMPNNSTVHAAAGANKVWTLPVMYVRPEPFRFVPPPKVQPQVPAAVDTSPPSASLVDLLRNLLVPPPKAQPQVPAVAAGPAQDPAYLVGLLRSLRQNREVMGTQLPPAALAELDAKITILELQTNPSPNETQR